MANTDRDRVIKQLRAFKHGVRTNAKKKTLTNHDAIAFLLWKLGPMTRRDIFDAVMEWRLGKPVWHSQEVPRYDAKLRTVVPKRIRTPQLNINYLFNSCGSGGYSFVADRATRRGWWMHSAHGYIYRIGGTNPGSKKAQAFEPQDKEPGDCDFFRRTYWYRTGKGLYAPTVECAKRMAEISSFLR